LAGYGDARPFPARLQATLDVVERSTRNADAYAQLADANTSAVKELLQRKTALLARQSSVLTGEQIKRVERSRTRAKSQTCTRLARSLC